MNCSKKVSGATDASDVSRIVEKVFKYLGARMPEKFVTTCSVRTGIDEHPLTGKCLIKSFLVEL